MQIKGDIAFSVTSKFVIVFKQGLHFIIKIVMRFLHLDPFSLFFFHVSRFSTFYYGINIISKDHPCKIIKRELRLNLAENYYQYIVNISRVTSVEQRNRAISVIISKISFCI